MRCLRSTISRVVLLCLGSNLALAQAFRYELARDENLRAEGDRAGEKILEPVAMLPKGTVIEVDDQDLRAPERSLRFNCDSFHHGPCDPARLERTDIGFVGHVRLV